MQGTEDHGSSNDAVLNERQGEVLIITLNRPNAMNSINGALAKGVADSMARLDADPELKVGVLNGAGQGFCAGMDLSAFRKGEDVTFLREFIVNGSIKPTIVAIDGFALGGGLELALSCDLIVASKGAKLGIPEAKVGLLAVGGGLLRLPTRVGFAKSMEMALSGDPILAEEGLTLGLVSRLTEMGDALATAVALAERISQNAPLAVAASKRLIRGTLGRTETEFWDFQEPIREVVFASNDAKEGPRAFSEKRSHQWTGN